MAFIALLLWSTIAFAKPESSSIIKGKKTPELEQIVLSGHLHHYSVLCRKTGDGAFVQLAMNSVIDIDERKVQLLEGINEYTSDLIDLEVNFDTKTKNAR